MTPRAVKLLHVEDDVSQRLIISKYLSTMKDFTFSITRAAAEVTALTEFARGGFDLVLLDYRLTLGNGLDCLRKLRQMDPTVPIVAMSGVATPELVEQMKQAGADEYINKDSLTAETLAACVRRTLGRAELRTPLLQACRAFAARFPPELFQPLDELEAAVRKAGLGAEQVQRLFASVYAEIDANRPPDFPPAPRLLRPVLGDVLAALQANPPGKPKIGSN